jgi:uncharacterized RDD family membrane protein YckC
MTTPSASHDRSTDPAVLAIDNIALDLPLAGIGSRVLAGALDQLVVSLLIVLWLIGGLFGLTALGVTGNWMMALLVVGAFVLQTGTFAIAEIATKGRTPGKRALRLRTVGSAGGTPTTGAFLIRNLLRVVDTLIGVPMMAADARSRRLGDHLAGTLVVHEERPEEEVALGEVPANWSGRQIALVESYLRRADELEPSQREYLGRRLVAMVQRDAPHLLEGETATTLTSDPANVLRRALIVVGGR